LKITVERTKTPKTIPPSKELGFGRFFSDHMALVDYKSTDARDSKEPNAGRSWQNPRIVPYGPLSLDPGAAVLHYGQELFEGLKAFRGDDGKVRLFRPEMNWKRMQSGAARICMQAPPIEIFVETLKEFCRVESRWIPNEPKCAFYLRPTLIGTEPFLGVRPSNDYLFYVIGSPVGSYYGEGADTVKIKVETEFVRAAPGGIGAAKTGGNYAASLRAALEAKQEGFAQVLWLDATERKYIEEVGTMNVFFKINGKLFTPPLDGTILPGVTRDSALRLLEEAGMRAEERPIALDEIVAASREGKLEEVFGTGTAASISPVDSLGVNGERIRVGDGKVGPVSAMLLKRLTDLQYGRAEDVFGWTLLVDEKNL
jgi:branched-chain amino acid aminotransferase